MSLSANMNSGSSRCSSHLQEPTSRRIPQQGPSSAFPNKGSPSLTSAFLQGPLHQGLHQGERQGAQEGPSSLSSAFLQGPSLNEIENCLAGLSAEEMEQVYDDYFDDDVLDDCQEVIIKLNIRVFRNSRYSFKKKVEPTKHQPGGYIERIQKDFLF